MKKFLSIFIAVCCLMVSLMVTSSAYTIQNNGVDGLYIDIESAPYQSLAQVPTWGQYAYTESGCAWYASARAKELTGKNIQMIYSGSSWYNTAYSYFGFSRSSTPKGKSLACWTNHVAVIEWVYGDSVTISEGGYTYGNKTTGYCVIRSVKISEIEAGNPLAGSFLGYVYLGVDDGTGTVPGKPDLWVETTEIQAGTNFVIHHWAENAKSYSISIYKDGQTIVSENIYSSTYIANLSAPGRYRIVAKGINEYGESEYSEIYVTIYVPHTHTVSDWIIDNIATCMNVGSKHKECTVCKEVLETASIPAFGHNYKKGICVNCGETDTTTPSEPDVPDTNYTFSIQTPSRTTIRNKDGIILHTDVQGNAPAGSYVGWAWNNSKFDVEKNNDGTLTIISENNGKTTFTATLYGADGNVLATDSIEMTSKAGFFDKIGGFFRSLFGSTTIYEY